MFPATRLLPSAVRAEENALRARLAQAFEFPANAHIAPLLARALDRVGECRRALGITRRWRVLRAQDDDGGSRYELGLGVDVEQLPPAELDALVANHVAGQIAADTPAAIRALLAQMQPQAATEDPRGRWLLGPCGLTTVHPLDTAKIVPLTPGPARSRHRQERRPGRQPDVPRRPPERAVRLRSRCPSGPRAG